MALRAGCDRRPREAHNFLLREAPCPTPCNSVSKMRWRRTLGTQTRWTLRSQRPARADGLKGKQASRQFDTELPKVHTAQSDDRNQSASRSSMANGVPPWLRLLVILLDMPPAWSVFSKQPGAFASAPRLGASHGHHPPYRARSALAGQTVSLNNRRKRAGWNVDYLETVIRADRITFKQFAWLRPLAPSKGRAFAIHPFG